jgi:hypothetical protein
VVAKRRRLTKEEREQRDRAYQSWVKHDHDYTATAAALEMDEKELRRWGSVHRWDLRWAEEQWEEIASLKQAIDKVSRLRTLVEGIDANGQQLYVSTELALDAAIEIIDINLSVGGETEQITRAQLRGMVPDAMVGLAQIALGVDKDGQPTSSDPEVRQMASEALVDRGLATENEIRTLSLRELKSRIYERLRARGLEPEPQS